MVVGKDVVLLLLLLMMLTTTSAQDTTNCYIIQDGTAVYSGTTAVDEFGRECQKWIDQSPISHPYNSTSFTITNGAAGPGIIAANNYCRDPSGGTSQPAGFLWCYIADGSAIWSRCGVPLCTPVTPSPMPGVPDPPECFTLQGNTAVYSGTTAMTRTGKPCQTWQSTHPIPNSFLSSHFDVTNGAAGMGYGGAANYCRDPSASSAGAAGFLWCYVSDGTAIWDRCDIPNCALTTTTTPTTTTEATTTSTPTTTTEATMTSSPTTTTEATTSTTAEAMTNTSPTTTTEATTSTTTEAMTTTTSTTTTETTTTTSPTTTSEATTTTSPTTTTEATTSPTTTTVVTTTTASTAVTTTTSPTTTIPTTSTAPTTTTPTPTTTTTPTTTPTTTTTTTTTPTTTTTTTTTTTIAPCFTLQGSTAVYSGTVSVTASGKTCQLWKDRSPNNHAYYSNYFDITNGDAGSGYGGASNYCRDPSGGSILPSGYVWCYLADSSGFEQCNITKCETTTTSTTTTTTTTGTATTTTTTTTTPQTTEAACFTKQGSTAVYSGTVAVTASGKTCQSWKAKSPNNHAYIASFFDITNGVVGAGYGGAGNYCRDPSGGDILPFGSLWCFLADSSGWETCAITQC